MISGLSIAFFTIILLMKHRGVSREILAARLLLFFLSMPLLTKVLQDFFPFSGPWISLLTVKSWPLMYGPLLYFYYAFLLGAEEKPEKMLVHSGPFIFFTLVNILAPVGPAFTDYNHLEFFLHGLFFYKIQGAVIAFSLIIYSAVIFRLLKKFRENLSEEYSVQNIYLTLRWADWLLYLFILSYGLSMLLAIFNVRLQSRVVDAAMNTVPVVLCIYVFAFFSIQERYRGFHAASQQGPPAEGAGPYAKSRIPGPQKKSIIEALVNHLDREKPYLDEFCKLDDIAARIGHSRHHVSQAINSELRKNFYTLINEYRVREAAAMLGDPAYRELSVLDIAYRSGFNSKSAFNRLFRESTGQTPGQFRQGRQS